MEDLRIETEHEVAHEGLVAFRAVVLAEATGAVAIKQKERVKQPGLLHARELCRLLDIVLLQSQRGVRSPVTTNSP